MLEILCRICAAVADSHVIAAPLTKSPRVAVSTMTTLTRSDCKESDGEDVGTSVGPLVGGTDGVEEGEFDGRSVGNLEGK
jgi:hypothetical protein